MSHPGSHGAAARGPDKSPDAFRTISEVAEDLDLPQHVLRFWETRFSQIRPLKRGGGRRYYRPDDVDLLKGIRHLLYGQGYTIRGVQRILKQQGVRFVQGVGRGEEQAAPPSTRPDDDDPSGDEAGAEAFPAGGELRESFGQEARRAPRGARSNLEAEDLRLLHDALEELLECERVLHGLASRPEGG